MSDAPKNFNDLWPIWRDARQAAFKDAARKSAWRDLPPLDLPGGDAAREIATQRLLQMHDEIWDAVTAMCRVFELMHDFALILPTASPASEIPASPDATERDC